MRASSHIVHQVTAALREVGLDKYAERIAPCSEPSIKIKATRCAQEDIAMGASRFGGMPDMPSGFEWPVVDEMPHIFLAQLDLANLPPLARGWLPATGWLTFFYDLEAWGSEPSDRASWLVTYFEGRPEDLVRMAAPLWEDEPSESFAPCRLSFTEVVDMPDYFGGAFEEMGFEFEDDEFERYMEASNRLRGLAHSDARYHHLLGLQQPIQDDMRGQLVTDGFDGGGVEGHASERAAALSPGAADWRLLLQLDTDEEGPGWMWGSAGRIYFWMREPDLRERDFAKTWLILQCT